MIQNHRKRTRASTSRAARRATAGLAAIALASTSFALTSPTFATATVEVPRTSGADRYATSAAVSAATFTTANDVVIASGTNYPDGLSAAALAGQLDAPVLLVPATGTLPTAIATEITRLGATVGYIIGGTAAITADMETQLETAGLATTTRYAGADRYSTSKAVNMAVTTIGTDNGKPTAFLATGGSFADALAASGPAFAAKMPLILTNSFSLNANARSALIAKAITRVLVVGGTTGISAGIVADMQSMGIEVVRFSGASRNDTAAALATYVTGDADFGFTNGGVVLTQGAVFADALSAGPHSGKMKHPLLYVESVIPAATSAYLTANAPTIATARIIGGPSAIPDSVIPDLKTAAGGTTTAPAGLAVSPSTAVTLTSVATIGDTDTSDDRQYTVTGLTAGTTYRVSLANGDNVTTSAAGVVSFTGSGTASMGTVASRITVINGTAVSTAATTALPVSGQIAFTVEGDVNENVVPVLWIDADTDSALDIGTGGVPSETFGLGGEINYQPAEQLAGAAVGAFVAITEVDKAANQAVASVLYKYDANDAYYIDADAGADADASELSTLTEFEAQLSTGDDLKTTTYQRNPDFTSTFLLQDDTPGLPTVSSNTPSNTSVEFTVATGSITADASVKVYVGPTGGGVFDATTDTLRATSAVDADLVAAGFQVAVTGLTESTPYNAFVSQTVDGEESDKTLLVAFTTTSSLIPTAPVSLSTTHNDADLSGLLNTGDNITITFNEAVAAAAGASLTIRDNDGSIGTLTNGTNATFSVGGTGNKVLTVLLTGLPTGGGGTAAGVNLLGADDNITAASGITDLDTTAKAYAPASLFGFGDAVLGEVTVPGSTVVVPDEVAASLATVVSANYTAAFTEADLTTAELVPGATITLAITGGAGIGASYSATISATGTFSIAATAVANTSVVGVTQTVSGIAPSAPVVATMTS